jgi:hypothetical protein
MRAFIFACIGAIAIAVLGAIALARDGRSGVFDFGCAAWSVADKCMAQRPQIKGEASLLPSVRGHQREM